MKGGDGIDRLKSRRKILRGYEKLAFGSVTDAVRLLFLEGDECRLDTMDLFNVAEIKRPKGGGMEIKFFDRIKALQCMEAVEDGGTSGGFLQALEAGAAHLQKEE